MNIKDEVLKSELFRHFASKFEGEELERLEKSICDMLEPVIEVHNVLVSRLADEEGVDKFAESLDKIIDDEGSKAWPQDKN
jgi:hypothetical protein